MYLIGFEPMTYNLEGYCSSTELKILSYFYVLLGLAGLEPTTFPLWAECSNQLNYRPIFFDYSIPDGIRTRVVPVKGEHPDRTRWQGHFWREWWDSNPRLAAWQATTLTNWVTSPYFLRVMGLEPIATAWKAVNLAINRYPL